MPKIVLENVTKRWGKFYAVDNLSLTIDDNAFVTLLGSSGCGKTTTLRMIAGLETPTEGKITIGDKVVFDSESGINVPANKRKVGFLFQNYALWPNMTVYKNIAFGLGNIKEKMPIYNFEAKRLARLTEILKNPDDVVKTINACRDLNGKIDTEKVIVSLIDTFEISVFTAKKLLATAIDSCKESNDKILDTLQTSLEKIKSDLSEKNLSLNEDFALTEQGQVCYKERKLHEEEIDLIVRRVARVVKIGMFMDRYPAELSGGQQQRVAIARTLAPEPTVLFMDEPLSNLDAKLRLEMRYELQRLHIETGSTFVYVTHDQMEAMTLATKICLLDNGVLQQYDDPLTVYNMPCNLFVADFVGNPGINFVDATEKSRGKKLALKVFNDISVDFSPCEDLNLDQWYKERDKERSLEEKNAELRRKSENYVEKSNKDEAFRHKTVRVEGSSGFLSPSDEASAPGDFVVAIRPEAIELCDDGKFQGEICGVMPSGMETTIKIRVNDFLLTSVVFGGVVYKIGAKIRFNFVGENILLFDVKSGKRICRGKIL